MKILPFRQRKTRHVDFEALVRRHIDHLYRLAYRFCGKREDAEDLVQDVFVKLYSRRQALADIDDLKPWLAKVLYRQFIDKTRQTSRSPIIAITAQDDLNELPITDGSNPQTDLENAQRLDQVQQAFDQLSEDHRILISLCDIEGYTLLEVQQVLDIPIGTLKSRLHRARAQFKNILDDGTF